MDDNAEASGGSNKGPNNDDLTAAITERRAEVAARERVAPADVPADAVTASGSGLDPYISPAYADLQIDRVARVRGLSQDRVRAWSPRTPRAARSASSASRGSTCWN